jgi:ABC-2 type transport system permease protein
MGPFGAIFKTEVLLNSKRIVPYALMVLFAANAVLWWGWGPAVSLGWATNSDYYIVRNLKGFAFLLGLPIFNAVIMGDPVIRDFRLGIDPLIFSKPISRLQYLLGKFFANFFVLVCCQAVFVLTLLVLQVFRTSQMIVQPVRVLPYFKHFFFFVVISHLFLAAVYFTVGTLTRNSKIVYLLAVCFYPLYIAYQVLLLKGLPASWSILLDPMLLTAGPSGNGFEHSAEYLNQLVMSYSAGMIANRGLMILIVTFCFIFLYMRFAITERQVKADSLSTLNLSTASDRVYYDAPETLPALFESREKVVLLRVTRTGDGFTANVKKLIAASGVEFRLLRAERSLVVLVPLAIFISTFELAFYNVVGEVSYSATYASATTNALLFFLLGMTVFYVGEGMHRDREVRIEPVLWATPAPNYVLLLSKFFAALLLGLGLAAVVGLAAITIQFLRGHPVELQPYLIVYSLILLPGLVFLAGVSIMLNVLLLDKYLTYAVSIGISAGLFYLYSIGYNHWLYNPLLYRVWTYADLIGGSNQLLLSRVYCLVMAVAFLAVAHVFFQRRLRNRQ